MLRAFPETKLDLKPAAPSKNARDLAWTLVGQEHFLDQVVKGQVNPGGPPAPSTMSEIISTYETAHREMLPKLRKMSEADFREPIKFFTGPRQMGDVPRGQVLWLVLMDSIHHRGQFSVYLRMAGGKLPSIYGPTADEPWM